MKHSIRIAFFALCAAAILPLSAAAQTIDKPVATVKLTKLEVYSLLQFKTDLKRVEDTLHTQLSPQQRLDFLNSQIDAMLFRQYCERDNIIVSEADVNQAYLQLKGQLGPGATDAAVDASLRSQGIYAEPKVYIKQQMLLNRYIQLKKSAELKAIKPPTSDEVLKEYELRKAMLIRPDSVRVSVIFIDLRGKSADERKKGQELMQSIADKVKNDPASFDSYMLKGMDPSSGYHATSSLLVARSPQSETAYGADFLDTVFALKVGGISSLMPNPTGYEIVRVNEVLPQKQLTLSDPVPGQPNATVQDWIVYELTMRNRQAFLKSVQDELVAKLRKEGSVKIFDDNLNF
ncbi:MAG TPA: peptidyl-prolyl cis-trans isomerase [Rectinemataceae bacterium]|nr:peptidyl-prolyl cis-trans isomerase [Rectinemataceae bacterium]